MDKGCEETKAKAEATDIHKHLSVCSAVGRSLRWAGYVLRWLLGGQRRCVVSSRAIRADWKKGQ